MKLRRGGLAIAATLIILALGLPAVTGADPAPSNGSWTWQTNLWKVNVVQGGQAGDPDLSNYVILHRLSGGAQCDNDFKGSIRPDAQGRLRYSGPSRTGGGSVPGSTISFDLLYDADEQAFKGTIRVTRPDDGTYDETGCNGQPQFDTGTLSVVATCDINCEPPAVCGVPSSSGTVIRGTNGSDTLVGNGLRNEIQGEAGQDKLNGAGGDDCVFGGANKDKAIGGPGNDGVDGGPGNDFVEGKNGNDVVDGGSGQDIVIGGTGRDKMRGGSGGDFLTDGARGRNTYDGGPGTDLIVSTNKDRDVIRCGSGRDEARVDTKDVVRKGCERVLRLRSRRPPGRGKSKKAKASAGKPYFRLWRKGKMELGMYPRESGCFKTPYALRGIKATVEQAWKTDDPTKLKLEFRLRVHGGNILDTTPDPSLLRWGAPSPIPSDADFGEVETNPVDFEKANWVWWARLHRFLLTQPETAYMIQVRATFKRRAFGYYRTVKRSGWRWIAICETGS